LVFYHLEGTERSSPLNSTHAPTTTRVCSFEISIPYMTDTVIKIANAYEKDAHNLFVKENPDV
jgi:hypothetical protein